MKVCSKCEQQKELQGFYKATTNVCKVCFKKQVKLNYINNKNRRLEQMKIHYFENKDKLIQQSNEYYRSNKGSILENKQKYFQENKSKITKRMNKYKTERRKGDINFKLIGNLRSRLNKALKSDSKTGSSVANLGCSIIELKAYLESKFQLGMTWENYGKWHIDHIKPLSQFNLTDKSQLLLACHCTNLQPLWAIDNIRKGSGL